MNNQNIKLSLFEEAIKLSGKNSIPLKVMAYRMDGNRKIPAMAKHANLGTPSSCDYLYIKNKKAVLIEDTNLGNQLKEIQLKIEELKNEYKDNKLFRAKTILRQENSLKVYGSLLILCRLSKIQQQVAKELKDIDSYNFFLVINDEEDIRAIDTKEVKGILDFLKKELPKSLSGQLGGAKLVKDVKILFAGELEEYLKKVH